MPNEFIARNGVIALNNSSITGSLGVTGGITGSLFGTSSWAFSSSVAVSSSFTTSGSYALSASNAFSASYSLSSSYVLSSSYALTSSYSVSSSYSATASLALTSSYLNNLNQNLTITGSLILSSSAAVELFVIGDSQITGSTFISGSLTITGSVRATQGGFTGSLLGTSSWANNVILAQSSSYPLSVGSGVLSSSRDFTVTSIGQTAGFGTDSTSAVGANFIGYFAGYQAYTSSYSNFIGYRAGYSQSLASHSVFLGYNAGFRATTMPLIGHNNIIIGTNITLPSASVNSINIGGILFGSGSYGDGGLSAFPFSGSVGNGRIGINVVSPQYNLDVSGSVNFTNGLTVTGSIILSGSQSYIGTKIVTGSLIVSNSLNVIGTQRITGSLIVSNSLSVVGTGNFTNGLVITGSIFPITSSISASVMRISSVGVPGAASQSAGILFSYISASAVSNVLIFASASSFGLRSQSLYVSGNLEPYPSRLIGLPGQTSSFDLGSPRNAWRRLYVGLRSVYFVDEDTGTSGSIGLDTGSLTLNYNDNPIIDVNGNISSSYPFKTNGSTIYSTLDSNTGNGASSDNSLFVGAAAGYQSSYASSSNFIGYQAGYQTDEQVFFFDGAYHSNFIGRRAGYQAIMTYRSNFIGEEAGAIAEYSNTSNFIGYRAGYQSSNASNSNFFGQLAGAGSGAPYSNFIGDYAGSGSYGSSNSNFIGNDAGRGSYSALHTVMVGSSAGFNSYNIDYGVYLGSGAGQESFNTYGSIGLGYGAGALTSGSRNTSIGFLAGANQASGSYNILLGFQAGNNGYSNNSSIGSNNIIIGTNITLEPNRNDSINLGGIIFATGSYFGTGIPSYNPVTAGKVGINISIPNYTLDVSGSGNYTNGLTVTGSLNAPNITGSLFGTSSWSSNAVTASYVTGSIYTSANPALSASYALSSSYSVTSSLAITASYVTGSVHNSANPALSASYALSSSYAVSSLSSSFSSTASYVNTLNQNVVITGSLTVGTSSIGANENTLVLGPSPAGGIGEGGQLLLQAPNSGGYTSASMLDNYQNLTRLLRGTNAGSDAVVASFNMHTKQVQFPQYNSTTAFTGTTLVGLLGFDSNGNLLTTNTGSGGGGTPVTITNNVDNYIITATGTANTINGESNLQFNGSTLSVTGNVTATSITSSNAVISLANGAMYFRGGDDAEFWDINVANTVGIYGQQNQGIGAIKLGSGGGTLTGLSGSIGIGTITPSNATVLDVVGTSNVSGTFLVTGSARFTGSVSATQGGFTGSLFGTSSWANNVITAQTASYVNNLNQNLSLTGSVILSGSAGIELTVLGDQQITGSLRVSNGVIAQSVSASLTGSLTGALIGTSSWATNALTASSLTILSQSIVTINASQGFRFPGFNVIDSGSGTTSGSLLFDSQNNNWLFVHSQTPSNIVTSSLLIMGPETFGNIGNETKLTTNRIPKSQGDEHIADSNIFDDGTNIQITGSNVIISGASTALIVTGSVRSLGGFTGSLFGTASWASNLVGGSTAFPYAGTATITGSVVQQTGSAFFPTLNASESLAAGDWINISASFVRKASSDNTTKQCHGFVIAAVSSGSAATIYYNGINPALTGLTVGARYFLSASGAESVNAPTITGQLSQEVGVAVSTTAILTNIGPAIIT
jgi:hypothetical protein